VANIGVLFGDAAEASRDTDFSGQECVVTVELSVMGER
jgi:hypothetical protein